jgi:membrane fusion protein (multidrug efflux system)
MVSYRLAAAVLASSALAFACKEEAPAGPPPPQVLVAPVIAKDVPLVSEWVGTLEGAVDADVRAQVSGTLLSREYKEGMRVKAGDLLFRIDDRTYRAALEQAEGELRRAEAAYGKASLDVKRYTPLAAEGAVSQQELDNAVQSQRAGSASVEAARAAAEQARIDVGFTEVRAPIDGVAGVAQAQVGNLVGPNDPNPLTRVSQLDPIRVSFQISEQEYLRFAPLIGKVVSGEAEERPAALRLVLADGSTWAHRGRAVPAAESVDPRTGTFQLRGEFPNPDQILRPGQYAKVQVVSDTMTGALLVPQRAVQELQGVYQVAVVGDGDKVSMRVVTPGPRHESLWVIEKGVAAGERVVVEGLQKVRDGMVVSPQPVPAEGAPAAPGQAVAG